MTFGTTEKLAGIVSFADQTCSNSESVRADVEAWFIQGYIDQFDPPDVGATDAGSTDDASVDASSTGDASNTVDASSASDASSTGDASSASDASGVDASSQDAATQDAAAGGDGAADDGGGSQPGGGGCTLVPTRDADWGGRALLALVGMLAFVRRRRK